MYVFCIINCYTIVGWQIVFDFGKKNGHVVSKKPIHF